MFVRPITMMHRYDKTQGAGKEFLYQATECKNIWLPMGTIFAN